MVSADAVHWPILGTVADELQTKPVYLLWFVLTCPKTPGNPVNPVAFLVITFFTAESNKGFFFFSFKFFF